MCVIRLSACAKRYFCYSCECGKFILGRVFMLKKSRTESEKHVVCSIPVIMTLMQEIIDIDAGGIELIILFENEKHKVGMSSDYNRKRGFFDPVFFLDEQEFDTFEKFKSQAALEGMLFADIDGVVEVIEADQGMSGFPWYTVFENFIVEGSVSDLLGSKADIENEVNVIEGHLSQIREQVAIKDKRVRRMKKNFIILGIAVAIIYIVLVFIIK